MDDKIFTVDEVAQMYPGAGGRPHLNPETVYRWIWHGVCGVKLIPSVSIGPRYGIRQSDLDKFHNEVAQAKATKRASAQKAAKGRAKKASEKRKRQLAATHGV